MSNSFLYLAGGIGLLTAIIHQYLGEARVLGGLEVPHASTRQLLSAIWFLSTLYWAAASLTLIAVPGFVPEAFRLVVVLVASAVLASGAIANFWAMRGRHIGWVLLGSASVLAFLGR